MISWVVVLALPATLSIPIFLRVSVESKAVLTNQTNIGLLEIRLFSMYLSFIPWYRGLKDAGTARGAQVQQLQVFLTLGFSVLLLDEVVPPSNLICAIGIVAEITWSIYSRQHKEI